MNVARLRLAPVRGFQVRAGGTFRFPQTPSTGPLRGRDAARLPPRAPFFRSRLRAAVDATAATTPEDGDVAYAPSPAHRPQGGL